MGTSAAHACGVEACCSGRVGTRSCSMHGMEPGVTAGMAPSCVESDEASAFCLDDDFLASAGGAGLLCPRVGLEVRVATSQEVVRGRLLDWAGLPPRGCRR